MKIKIICFILGLLTIVQLGCKKEHNADVPSKGSFAIGFQNPVTLKSDNAVDAIIISVENAAGEKILSSERILLLKTSNGFVCESIELEIGTYQLISFVVVDAQNNILYVTPQTGSAQAININTPLPLSFTIKNSETSNLVMDVIDPALCDCNPADYGYVNFDFNIIEQDCPSNIYSDFYIVNYSVNYGWGFSSHYTITNSSGVVKSMEGNPFELGTGNIHQDFTLNDSITETIPFDNLATALGYLPAIKNDLISEEMHMADFGSSSCYLMRMESDSTYTSFLIWELSDVSCEYTADENMIAFCESLGIRSKLRP